MKTLEITDNTPVASINALATICAQTYGNINTLEHLASLLISMVGKPMRSISFLNPKGKPIPQERRLPSILTGSSECSIRLVKENGIAHQLCFPSTVGSLDAQIARLAKAQTEDEVRFEAFQQSLLDTLDAYGHMTWTVGNEDWTACADAAVGRFDGKLFLAWHVVVDCESGGFTETLEKGCEEIAKDRLPPQGILHPYLDTCAEIYASADSEGAATQIDTERCLAAIRDFDQYVQEIWTRPEENLAVDADETEAFDPIAMGWVGHDGRP